MKKAPLILAGNNKDVTCAGDGYRLRLAADRVGSTLSVGERCYGGAAEG
jgi:hypothetical protein